MSRFGYGTKKEELYEAVRSFVESELEAGEEIHEIVEDAMDAVGQAMGTALQDYERKERGIID